MPVTSPVDKTEEKVGPFPPVETVSFNVMVPSSLLTVNDCRAPSVISFVALFPCVSKLPMQTLEVQTD